MSGILSRAGRVLSKGGSEMVRDGSSEMLDKCRMVISTAGVVKVSVSSIERLYLDRRTES